MKSFFTNITNNIIFLIGKMISLLFVKVTISSAENVIDRISDFSSYKSAVLENARLEFFSRSYEVDVERKRTVTEATYLCKKGFYYIAKMRYDGPLATVYRLPSRSDHETIQEDSFCEVVRHIDLYIPFWRFKKESNLFDNDINDVFDIPSRQVFFERTDLKNYDISKHNQDDYIKLGNLIDEKIKSCKTDEPYISLESKNCVNVIQNIAKEKNMDVYFMHEYLSSAVGKHYIISMLESYAKKMGERPFILYISCGNDSESIGDFYDWITSRETYIENSFNYLNDKIIESVLSHNNYVIVLDKYGLKNNPEIISKNLKILDNYSTKIEVAYND